jgi:hypothetical protein
MMAAAEALAYAILIIENYEMDVRAWMADGRIPSGFCQGSIYRTALRRLDELATAPPASEVP